MMRVSSNPNLGAAPLVAGAMPRPSSVPDLRMMTPGSSFPAQAYGPGGYATMVGAPPAGLLSGSMSFIAPIPSAPFTQTPRSFRPPGSGIGIRPGEVLIEISRLLDMPMQEKLFSADLKQYRVRAFDDYYDSVGNEIGRTSELAGMAENFATNGDVDTETLRLGPEGVLRVVTQSPVIHLQVEYAGGFLGNRRIGRCRIARADQRSREVWPYALSNRMDMPVGCGIELRVNDAGAGMPAMGASFQTMPPMGMGGPSFQTMPPMGTPPGSMGPSFRTMPPQGNMDSYPGYVPFDAPRKGKGKGKPPTSGASSPGWATPPGTPPGSMGPSFQTTPPQQMPSQMFKTMAPGGPPSGTTPKNVFVLVEVEKVTDIPAPVGGGPGMLMLRLERMGGEAIGPPIGPFKTEAQGELRQVMNLQGKLTGQLAMEDLAKESTDLRVVASYQGNQKPVGAAPISASWKPVALKYIEFQDKMQKGVGGISCAYRYAQQADLNRSMIQPVSKTRNTTPPRGTQVDVSSTSGKFARGGQDAVVESAALAVEAQNRALKQRINLATRYDQVITPAERESGTMWENGNGYRDWSSMDSLFISMGPNYVAQSPEMGSNVCRVYNDDTSVWQELKNKPGLKPKDPRNEIYAKELVGSLVPQDIDRVQQTLRPVVCKDMKDIQKEGMRNANNKPSLKVKVIAAQNLRTKTGFLMGEIHPKVVIEIPGKSGSRWQSQAAPDGTNVEWNEEGIIPGWFYGDGLKVTVVDKAFLGFAGETHLGEARLQSSDFYPTEWRAAMPLSGAGAQGNTVSSRNPGSPRTQLATLILEIKVQEPQGASSNWPPYPAMFAPCSNLNESDQETQRLANWDANAQNAKLPFADVNPNYQMDQDIWGSLKDGKSAEETVLLQKPVNQQQPRVKDACPIA